MEISKEDIHRIKYILKNIRRTRTEKIECHETHALEPEEHQKIINIIKEEKPTKRYRKVHHLIKKRDVLIATVQWRTAQRISAILQIQLQDINLESRKINFTADKSKTKTDHPAYIDDIIFDLIVEHLKLHKEKIQKPTDYLFFAFAAHKTERLQYIGFYKRWIEYVKKAGIQKLRFIGKRRHYAITPHTTRSGIITHLLLKGVSPAKVQRLSGHKSIDVMMKHYNKMKTLDVQKEIATLI